jgi:hypothetical protein
MPLECTLKWHLPTGWGRAPLMGGAQKIDGSVVPRGSLCDVRWGDLGVNELIHIYVVVAVD